MGGNESKCTKDSMNVFVLGSVSIFRCWMSYKKEWTATKQSIPFKNM